MWTHMFRVPRLWARALSALGPTSSSEVDKCVPMYVDKCVPMALLHADKLMVKIHWEAHKADTANVPRGKTREESTT